MCRHYEMPTTKPSYVPTTKRLVLGTKVYEVWESDGSKIQLRGSGDIRTFRESQVLNELVAAEKAVWL